MQKNRGRFSARALPGRRWGWIPSLVLAALLAGCGGGSNNVVSTSGGTATSALQNPDHILFASGRAEDETWQFYVMNPDGSDVTAVTSLQKYDARLCEGIAFNRTGADATIAFDYGTGAGTERMLFRLSDGTKLLDIISTFDTGTTVFAANSTGSKVAVAGSPAAADPQGIYVMNPDGSQKTKVYALPAGGTASEITFGPDDQTLYYVFTPAGAAAPTLYKLAQGAATPTPLLAPGVPIQSVHFSQDGSKIAFVSVVVAVDNSKTSITAYTLNADGSGLTKGVTTTLTGIFFAPDISIASRADGFHVLYVSKQDGSEEIYDMHPDGTAVTQLTYNAAGNTTPGGRAISTAASLPHGIVLGGR
jgi:Tol biopolymer transport system component